MSWIEFYLSIATLVFCFLLLVALPWVRKRSAQTPLSASNVAVVKQRLVELEREVSEGLLSEQDKRQASDEIKVALVDESQKGRKSSKTAMPIIIIGMTLALLIAGWVYSQTNNIWRLRISQEAIEALPELSTKLAQGSGENLTANDFQQLTLAIRSRLHDAPDDGQGWMYLGRILLALDQQEQAFAAYDKAMQYAPNDSNVRTNYARALLASDDRRHLQNAKQILSRLLVEDPNNSNLILMLAVVGGRLGDELILAKNLVRLDGKLPEDNPLMQQLQSRLSDLRGEQVTAISEQTSSDTGFVIDVTISDDLTDKLPEGGFIFVFAQDAQSGNRMPAAVLRLPLSALPMQITLTDKHAMTPNYSLKQLSEVRLMARVSADQEAPAVKGDIEGVVNAKVVQGNILSARIVIDKEIM